MKHKMHVYHHEFSLDCKEILMDDLNEAIKYAESIIHDIAEIKIFDADDRIIWQKTKHCTDSYA